MSRVGVRSWVSVLELLLLLASRCGDAAPPERRRQAAAGGGLSQTRQPGAVAPAGRSRSAPTSQAATLAPASRFSRSAVQPAPRGLSVPSRSCSPRLLWTTYKYWTPSRYKVKLRGA